MFLNRFQAPKFYHCKKPLVYYISGDISHLWLSKKSDHAAPFLIMGGSGPVPNRLPQDFLRKAAMGALSHEDIIYSK